MIYLLFVSNQGEEKSSIPFSFREEEFSQMLGLISYLESKSDNPLCFEIDRII